MRRNGEKFNVILALGTSREAFIFYYPHQIYDKHQLFVDMRPRKTVKTVLSTNVCALRSVQKMYFLTFYCYTIVKLQFEQRYELGDCFSLINCYAFHDRNNWHLIDELYSAEDLYLGLGSHLPSTL